MLLSVFPLKNLTKLLSPSSSRPPAVTTHKAVTPWSLEVICHSQYHAKSIGAMPKKNHFKQVLNVKDTIHIIRINIDIYVFSSY